MGAGESTSLGRDEGSCGAMYGVRQEAEGATDTRGDLQLDW